MSSTVLAIPVDLMGSRTHRIIDEVDDALTSQIVDRQSHITGQGLVKGNLCAAVEGIRVVWRQSRLEWITIQVCQDLDGLAAISWRHLIDQREHVPLLYKPRTIYIISWIFGVQMSEDGQQIGHVDDAIALDVSRLSSKAVLESRQ